MQLDITRVDGYNVATALRGPDVITPVEHWRAANRCKSLTTAVLRYFLDIRPLRDEGPTALVYSPGEARTDWVSVSESRFIATKQQALDWFNSPSAQHFRWHFWTGADSLVKLLMDPSQPRGSADTAATLREYLHWLECAGFKRRVQS